MSALTFPLAPPFNATSNDFIVGYKLTPSSDLSVQALGWVFETGTVDANLYETAVYNATTGAQLVLAEVSQSDGVAVIGNAALNKSATRKAVTTTTLAAGTDYFVVTNGLSATLGQLPYFSYEPQDWQAPGVAVGTYTASASGSLPTTLSSMTINAGNRPVAGPVLYGSSGTGGSFVLTLCA